MEHQSLSRYRIEQELGRGASGIVYQALDTGLERQVAVKTVSTAGLDAREKLEILARFKREATAAARLSHPNIVTVYDFGHEKDTAYIVMELVPGTSLGAIMGGAEAPDFERICALMKQLLAALHFAHEHGVVHRDIKPSNILLLPNGELKIADFGVARLESSTVTRAGTILGTPSYMAPEQLAGKTVDRRADLFSAGVILYELLTGRRPFVGDSTYSVIYQVLHTEPPLPSQLDLPVPKWVDGVVRKALAKKPEERFQDAREFAQALDVAAQTLSASTTPTVTIARDAAMARPTHTSHAAPAAGPRAWAGYALGGAVCLVLVAAGGWWWKYDQQLGAASLSQEAPRVAAGGSASSASAPAATPANPVPGKAALEVAAAEQGSSHAAGGAGDAAAHPATPMATVALALEAVPQPKPGKSEAAPPRTDKAKPNNPPAAEKTARARETQSSPPAVATPSNAEAPVQVASLPAQAPTPSQTPAAAARPLQEKMLPGELLPDNIGDGMGEENKQLRGMAINLLRRAAEAGDPRAMNRLGNIYREGKVVPRDLPQAAQWYERAANAGNVGAQISLAHMYHSGQGVERDDAKALAMLQKSAEGGHPKALNALGAMYFKGSGVPQDDQKAAQYFKLAAEKNEIAAMFNYAYMLESGRGVTRDERASAQWYKRAADQGEPRARQRMLARRDILPDATRPPAAQASPNPPARNEWGFNR